MSLWSKIKKTVTTSKSDDDKKSNSIVLDTKLKEKKEEKEIKKEKKTTDLKKEKGKKLSNITIADVKEDTGDAYKILISPLVTEKTVRFEAEGKYAFRVSRSANKIMIKGAIKKLYGVTPKKIAVISMPARRVKFRWRKGVQPAWKKAIVSLKKGEKIDLTT